MARRLFSLRLRLAAIGLLGATVPSCATDRATADSDPDSGGAQFQVVCSTYLGGSGYDEGREILRSPDGSIVVGGQTYSAGMPTPGGFQTSYRSAASTADGPGHDLVGGDSYLAVLAPDCSAVRAGTYLGGSQQERPVYGMQLVPDGLIVSGVTRSADFPTTPGAYQSGYGGGLSDSWLVKIPVSLGRLTWATYLGGPIGEWARAGVSVDAAGSIWVGGTINDDAGTVNGLVYRVAPDGASVPLRVSIGGSLEDHIVGILALPGGEVFVNGHTQSTDFPRTTGPGHAGGYDTFFARLSSAGAVVWSRLDGGSGDEYGEHRPVLCDGRIVVPTTTGVIVLDPATGAVHSRIATPGWAVGPSCGPDGRVYVGGVTDGAKLVTRGSALQDRYQGGESDGWFMVARTDGTVEYATYLGGEGEDLLRSATVTDSGSVLLTGRTNSSRFPISGTPFQQAHRGNGDMFVMVLRPVARSGGQQ